MLLQNDNVTWLKEFLVGDQDWTFLAEVLLRTFIMYTVILLGLRTMGKRGVKQLSLFELVVIIGLGSAAGDPMFYKEVGILTSIIVFIVIVMAYKGTAHLIGKSKKAEVLLEGSCTCLVERGEFAIHNFEKESLAQDEFFSELRLKGISHLGQVDLAIIETSGSISVFYYQDEDVKYGLPILPFLFDNQALSINEEGHYSCAFCGNTLLLGIHDRYTCPKCKRHKWVKSIKSTRIT